MSEDIAHRFMFATRAPYLFVAQGFDWVQSGGAVGRVEAKEDADAQRYGYGQQDALTCDQRLAGAQERGNHLRPAHAQDDANQPTQEATYAMYFKTSCHNRMLCRAVDRLGRSAHATQRRPRHGG